MPDWSMKDHAITCTGPLVCAAISRSSAGIGLPSTLSCALVSALICGPCV